MKKRFLSGLLAMMMLFGILGGMLQVNAASVHTVSTAAELYALAERVNAGEDFSDVKVVLTADIVLNEDLVDSEGVLLREDGEVWNPIGNAEHPFTGIFDGKGYAISGMYINNTSAAQALLGVISGATVYNVVVKDSYVCANSEAAAVVGYATNESLITNCRNENTTINCIANRGGGIVGHTNHSDVYNCTNYGTIYSARCAGGIVGDVYSYGNIYNCVNHGSVNGRELVGGITGGSTNADIENCLSVGAIGSGGYIIAGGGGSRSIDHCYGLKNDTVNTNNSFGSSGTSATIVDAAGALPEGFEVKGTPCATVLEALNAWRVGRTDGVAYHDWLQADSFPYLNTVAIPSVVVMTEDTFKDVTPEEWYYDEVKYVYDNGLMNGVAEGEFRPSISTSRAMVVTILYRQEGEPAAARSSFSDVPEGQWYTAAVDWAAENGIVTGYEDGSFLPDRHISRQEMAAIMYRYSSFKGNDVSARADLNSFSDVADIGSWAAENVSWAVAEGIINGVGDGTLKPKNPAQRSHVAAILMRYCTNLV